MYQTEENRLMLLEFKPNRGVIRYPLNQDLETYVNNCRRIGVRVIETTLPANKVIQNFFPYSLEPINCVTLVKIMLGVKARWIWTPLQLYVYLKKQKHTKEL